jgi:hypothetical protein
VEPLFGQYDQPTVQDTAVDAGADCRGQGHGGSFTDIARASGSANPAENLHRHLTMLGTGVADPGKHDTGNILRFQTILLLHPIHTT